MKHLEMVRLPWAIGEKGIPVYYEFRVGKVYADMGICKAIVEHEPGEHYEVLIGKKAVGYHKMVITERELEEDENQE